VVWLTAIFERAKLKPDLEFRCARYTSAPTTRETFPVV
jgi:hypothetical protein